MRKMPLSNRLNPLSKVTMFLTNFRYHSLPFIIIKILVIETSTFSYFGLFISNKYDLRNYVWGILLEIRALFEEEYIIYLHFSGFFSSRWNKVHGANCIISLLHDIYLCMSIIFVILFYHSSLPLISHMYSVNLIIQQCS